MPVMNPPSASAPQGPYTVTGVDTDRVINVDLTTLNELLNVLGTLILDLKVAGILN